MPIVALPDGQQLNFPDGMSQPDMAEAIAKNFPQFAPKESTLSKVGDALSSAYHAVVDSPQSVMDKAGLLNSPVQSSVSGYPIDHLFDDQNATDMSARSPTSSLATDATGQLIPAGMNAVANQVYQSNQPQSITSATDGVTTLAQKLQDVAGMKGGPTLSNAAALAPNTGDQSMAAASQQMADIPNAPDIAPEESALAVAKGIGKGTMEGIHQLARAAGYVATAPALVADMLDSLVTGQPNSDATDIFKQKFIDSNTSALDYWKPTPAQENDLVYRIADSLGQLVPQLPLMGAAGASAAIETPVTATVLEGVANHLKAAFATMSPMAVSGSINRAADLTQQGIDPLTAIKAATAEFAATEAMGIIPVGAAGGVFKRAATGAASMVGIGALGTTVQNIATSSHPELYQDPYSTESVIESGINGALFGVMFGHSNQIRKDAWLPVEIKPIADQPVSAEHATPIQPTTPEVSIADQMLAIRGRADNLKSEQSNAPVAIADSIGNDNIGVDAAIAGLQESVKASGDATSGLLDRLTQFDKDNQIAVLDNQLSTQHAELPAMRQDALKQVQDSIQKEIDNGAQASKTIAPEAQQSETPTTTNIDKINATELHQNDFGNSLALEDNGGKDGTINVLPNVDRGLDQGTIPVRSDNGESGAATGVLGDDSGISRRVGINPETSDAGNGQNQSVSNGTGNDAIENKPWQMTYKEYADEKNAGLPKPKAYFNEYQQLLKSAIDNGEIIPARVLEKNQTMREYYNAKNIDNLVAEPVKEETYPVLSLDGAKARAKQLDTQFHNKSEIIEHPTVEGMYAVVPEGWSNGHGTKIAIPEAKSTELIPKSKREAKEQESAQRDDAEKVDEILSEQSPETAQSAIKESDIPRAEQIKLAAELRKRNVTPEDVHSILGNPEVKSEHTGGYELQQIGAVSGEWKTVQKYNTQSEADAALPKGTGWRIIKTDAAKGEVKPPSAKETDKWITIHEPESQYNIHENDTQNNGISGSAGSDRMGQLAAKTRIIRAARAVQLKQTKASPGIYYVTSRLEKTGERELPDRINSTQDAANATAYLARNAVEHFDAIVTDASGKPLAVIGSFKGAATQASVYPSTLVQELAKIKGAANLWASHNHPSGKAELSGADKRLSSVIGDLLEGSGVTYRGLLAVAKNKFESTDYSNGEIVEHTGKTIKAPIVERVTQGDPLDDLSISSPATAKTIIPNIAKGQTGIVFLSSQHSPVAFVPFKAEEMMPLRQDDRLMRLFRSAADTGASTAMIANPENHISLAQAGNLSSALKVLDINTLDMITYDSKSPASTVKSSAELGHNIGPNQMFFSRNNPEGRASYQNRLDEISRIEKSTGEHYDVASNLYDEGFRVGEDGGIHKDHSMWSQSAQEIVNPHSVESARQELIDAHEGRDKAAIQAMMDSGKVKVITANDASNIREVTSVRAKSIDGLSGTKGGSDNIFPAEHAGRFDSGSNRNTEAGTRTKNSLSYITGTKSTLELNTASKTGKIDSRHDVTPFSDVGLGDRDVATSISPTIIPKDIQAFYNPIDKTTYFIADNISRNTNLKKLAQHEISVHAYHLGKDTPEFNDILRQVDLMRKSGNKAVNDAYNRVPADTVPEHVNEEALAYLVQNFPDLSIVKRVIAWMRNSIRAIGKSMPSLQRLNLYKWAAKLTPDDLLYMAQTALGNRYSDEQKRQNDMQAQGSMLTREAAKRGFDSIHDFAASDPSGFGQAAEKWRSQHMMMSAPQDRFYSQLRRTFRDTPDKIFQSGKQVALWLDSNASKFGVKKDEIYWSGVSDWLKTQGKVSKNDVLDFLDKGGVQVKEVMLNDVKNKLSDPKIADDIRRLKDSHVTVEYDGDNYDGLNRNYPVRFIEQIGRSKELHEGRLPAAYFDKDTIDASERVNSYLLNSEKYGTKFSQYVLPGGENYKELLLTLPDSRRTWTYEEWKKHQIAAVDMVDPFADSFALFGGEPTIKEKKIPDTSKEEYERQKKTGVLNFADQEKNFKSSHYDQPNILAHVRFDERTDSDGKKVLMVQEIQSDWGQKGKKEGFGEKDQWQVISTKDGKSWGYFATEDDAKNVASRIKDDDVEITRTGNKNTGVLAAPFVTDTKAWTALALKHIISYAVDHGFDKVAFTTGEQQAERYDLSKQVDRVEYWPESKILTAYKNGHEVIQKHGVEKTDLSEIIGKDVAQKLIDEPVQNGVHQLRGDDLKIGGEGMKGYYDSIVPQVANDILRKMDAGKVDKTTIYAFDKNDGSSSVLKQPSFDITPELRAKVTNEGMPLFSRATKSVKQAEIADASEDKSKIPGAWMIDSIKNFGLDILNSDAVRDVKMATIPMSTGVLEAKSAAQTFINNYRVAQHQWQRMSELLTDKFTPEQRAAMWDAADEQNTLMQQGKPTQGKGIDSLPADQRAVMNTLHTYAKELWARAQDAGMVSGEGMPYWTPRMAVLIGEDGEFQSTSNPGKKTTSNGDGRNINTTSSSLKHRKYLTKEETEEAMKGALGDSASLVHDILTMPLAMARLEKAIAGRELVNQIKAIGLVSGKDIISTGEGPGFITIDHPAFTTFKPKMIDSMVSEDELSSRNMVVRGRKVFKFTEDGDKEMKSYSVSGDGTVTQSIPAIDQNGDTIFEKTPMFISKDWEGPLKAVMSTKDGVIYSGYMLVKSKAMSAIMASFLTHNMVILGRALAYSPLKVGSLKAYFTGHALLKDDALVNRFIGAGWVNVGANRSSMMSIENIASPIGKKGSWGDPNESWINLGMQKLGNALKSGMGDSIKNALDKIGNFYHHDLLWKQVAALQLFICNDYSNYLVSKGHPQAAADAIAAHLANRYGGAVGRENQSELARKAMNVILFSRSFNVGNIGSMKDTVFGLPAGLAAKIYTDVGVEAGNNAMKAAKGKARAGLAADLGMSMILTGVASAAVQTLMQNQTVDDIESGYVRRLGDMFGVIKDHPLSPSSYNPYQVLPTWDNEPGKQDRIDMGADKTGRHQYMRLPTGKVVEDLTGWLLHAPDTFAKKMSPVAKSVSQAIMNDKGYGIPVEDPEGNFVKHIGQGLEHVIEAQIPLDTMKTLYDVSIGKGTSLDKDKLTGFATGFSTSQGNPLGPEGALAYAVQDRMKMQKAYSMESMKHDIKVGNIDGAKERLAEIGYTPLEISRIIHKQEYPKTMLSTQQMQSFYKHATDDEKARMKFYKAKN